jgi:hypothetical protein
MPHGPGTYGSKRGRPKKKLPKYGGGGLYKKKPKTKKKMRPRKMA